MGAGFAQVGIVLLLTVIALPLCFFGLMAALDKFEQTLSASPRAVQSTAIAQPPATQPAAPPGAVAPLAATRAAAGQQPIVAQTAEAGAKAVTGAAAVAAQAATSSAPLIAGSS